MIYRRVKDLPPFLATHTLREVHQAAVIYAQATGDQVLRDRLASALTYAEGLEKKGAYTNCIVCDRRIPLDRKYCGFDCAETDGAIEK